VFGRYSQPARRALFFARYEASAAGSPAIESEHLLLALIREDIVLRSALGFQVATKIRAGIEQSSRPLRSVSSCADIPMSSEVKTALKHAAEEADVRNCRDVAVRHLVLGLLRVEQSKGAAMLRDNGVNLTTYGELCEPDSCREPDLDVALQETALALQVASAALAPFVTALSELIEHAAEHLDTIGESRAEQRLARKPWSRKQALGHLIDWASSHQQWIARALTGPALRAALYPQSEWVAAQAYDTAAWQDLVDLWISQNRMLVHVLSRIPEDKLAMECRIGIAEPISLASLVEHYVQYATDLMGQILSRGTSAT
jgi:hypothetical protein